MCVRMPLVDSHSISGNTERPRPERYAPTPDGLRYVRSRPGSVDTGWPSANCLSASSTRDDQEPDPKKQPPVHSGHEDDTENGVANCVAPYANRESEDDGIEEDQPGRSNAEEAQESNSGGNAGRSESRASDPDRNGSPGPGGDDEYKCAPS